MRTLTYYLSLPLLYLISVMPFPVLYMLSDLTYLIAYRVFGYRKRIVMANLRYAFPEKEIGEIDKICRRFYRFFFDMIFETSKMLTITKRSILRRVTFSETRVLEKYQDEGRSVILVLGHLGNWELGGARFANAPVHDLNVIYKKLKNAHFDRLVKHMRNRVGVRLYRSDHTLRHMYRDRHKITGVAFLADQKPSKDQIYWVKFFDRDTAAFKGMATLAKKFDYPIIYVSVLQTRRGHYTMRSEELIADPSRLSEEAIVQFFFHRLEQDIRKCPHIWLWTHRRWRKKGSQTSDIYD